MATKKKTTVKRKKTGKNRNTGAKVIFWLAFVLFITPFAVLGWILVSAAMDTNSPIIGSRYDGDLDPAITKSDLDTIEKNVRGMTGVQAAEVNLATGTLRVYADITDSASAEEAKSMADQVYRSVIQVLPVDPYFTQAGGKKMYDLEVHVYNSDKNTEDDSFIYVIETRNSSMAEPVVQLVSEPVDAELAEQLRQAVENRLHPTPTPTAESEMEVGGEETAQG
ncbi:MAG: heavy-metal-associated domain-containing protein [Solobacterium sp.]|nr:heavy-metal-associated domain-containing protein [Solobacterium sp.]